MSRERHEEERAAYEIEKILPSARFESFDEFRIELIIGEPWSSSQFDRGIDSRQHVDLSRRILMDESSAIDPN